MIKKESGHIVTMASMAGLSAVNNLVDYCSSKHAAIGFDDALRSELIASLYKIVNQIHCIISKIPIKYRPTVIVT